MVLAQSAWLYFLVAIKPTKAKLPAALAALEDFAIGSIGARSSLHKYLYPIPLMFPYFVALQPELTCHEPTQNGNVIKWSSPDLSLTELDQSGQENQAKISGYSDSW